MKTRQIMAAMAMALQATPLYIGNGCTDEQTDGLSVCLERLGPGHL